MKRKLLAIALITGSLAGTAAASSVTTGNLLAIDQTAGTSGEGVLFIDDQSSGIRTLFSDFGNSTQGPTGVDPNAVAWVPATLLGLLGAGQILVTDGSGGTNKEGALYQIDPIMGNRVLLSDFGNSAQGPVGEYPSGVLVAPGLLNGLLGGSGVLVVDPYAGTNGQGAVFSVNANGNRAILSDFGDKTGPQGQYPDSMAYLPNLLGLGGTVLVADGGAGTNGEGELFKLDPTTGARSVLSDFGSSAQGWVDPNPESTPVSVTVSPAGQIYVLVQELSAGGGGAVVKVDPSTGDRTLVTDFSDASEGPTGIAPDNLAWLSSGLLGVTDADAGPEGDGELFTVDPSTGQRNTLSDFGNSQQGALGSEPSGLTIAQ